MSRLVAMHRETKLKELQLLDAARRKFLHFQKQQREAELRRLDDEMQRKVKKQVVCVCVREREKEGGRNCLYMILRELYVKLLSHISNTVCMSVCVCPHVCLTLLLFFLYFCFSLFP